MRNLTIPLMIFGTALSGCSNDPTGPAVVPTIAIVSGNQQTGSSNATLTNPLVIKVSDPSGAPIAGKRVTWTPAGGASVTPGQSNTDAAGLASTTVKLGASGGTLSVRADVPGADPVTFTITSTGPEPLIRLVSTITVPASGVFQHDSYIRDGIAFLCAWNNGLLIYDVGNGVKGGTPAAPIKISSILTSTATGAAAPFVHNAWWFHNPVTGEKKYVFVGQEGPGTIGSASSGDIHVVDVSNMEAPVEVARLSIGGAGTHNFWMDEARQVLYAAYYNAGVIAVDVSGTLSGNLESRIIAQTTPGGPGNTYVWGVHFARNTVYVSDMLTGVWALDPVTLAVRGTGNNVLDRYSSDLWVSGDVLYSGTWGSRLFVRGNMLKIWSVAGPGPVLVDSMVVSEGISTVSDVGVTPDSRVLVLTGEGGSLGGLFLYDLHDKRHPTLIASVTAPGGLHTGKISVIGGRTYVFASKNPSGPALLIYDITGAVNASTAP